MPLPRRRARSTQAVSGGAMFFPRRAMAARRRQCDLSGRTGTDTVIVACRSAPSNKRCSDGVAAVAAVIVVVVVVEVVDSRYRQNRSVTLGKGLALRVGYRGPCFLCSS